MVVHISQFYACSEVKLACELYYICELGKYTKACGHELSLDGVILDEVLKKSPIWKYFEMCVKNGWMINTGVVPANTDYDLQQVSNFYFLTEEVPFDSEDSSKRKANMTYARTVPKKLGVSFEVMDDMCWKWSIGGYGGEYFNLNNESMNGSHADQKWLSLIAMAACQRQFGEAPKYLWIVLDENLAFNVRSFSYLITLMDESTCFTNWVRLDISRLHKETYLQLTYNAWYAKGRDLGLCGNWFSGRDKLAYMKKLDIQDGDLVMLYERKQLQKLNHVKEIFGCHLAKLISHDERGFVFDVINTVMPYYSGKVDFDNHDMVVKQMWNGVHPYEYLNHTKQTLDIIEVGVEFLLLDERYFFVPLNESDDLMEYTVFNGESEDTLKLTQNELIYWIMKDYKYDFNEQRFLDKFFKYDEPLYTRYMRGDTLEDKYYVRDDKEE